MLKKLIAKCLNTHTGDFRVRKWKNAVGAFIVGAAFGYILWLFLVY